MVRSLSSLVILVAFASHALAQPADQPPPPPPDQPPVAEPTPEPTPAPVPAVTATPDLTPAAALERLPDSAVPDVKHPTASIAIVGGMYITFSSWAYLAWYVKHKPLSYYKWGGDGWLGSRTYAGGADKFGHAWATMNLARAGTAILSDFGGYDHFKSSLISTALSETLFFFVEVKDGFFYEFSPSDLTGDTVGAIMALLFDNIPKLDEMFDYRVQYFPSKEYWDNVAGSNNYGRLNIAEDYSGETYLLAYHLGSIHSLREQPVIGTLSRFVDLTAGFDSRGYKPSPPAGYPDNAHHQNMFIGVSFNAQGFFYWVFEGHTSSKAKTARKITHGLFEIFNLPFTSAPILQHSTSPTGTVTMDGA